MYVGTGVKEVHGLFVLLLYRAIPETAGLGEGWKPAGEGYAMKVLDEDLLGFDLDGDFREQVDLDGAPARGRERKPPARVTGGGMDMTGLIGGVDQGDGWAKFGLRDGEAADVGDDMPKPFGDEDDGMADEDDVLDEELDFGGIRVVDIGKNGVGEGIGGGSAAAAAASDGDDDDASAIMERRIRYVYSAGCLGRGEGLPSPARLLWRSSEWVVMCGGSPFRRREIVMGRIRSQA